MVLRFRLSKLLAICLLVSNQDKTASANEKVPSDALNIEGIAHAKRGDYHEAIRCFIRAQNLNPNNATSWYNIGTSLAMVNKEDKALFILYCYDRAIELDSNNAEAWNNKGAILELMGAKKNALFCYERALEIRPGYVSAMRNIELLLKKLGRNAESKKYSKQYNTPPPSSFTEALHYVSFD
jgi:tetratricopeptide (TPR) repeat protein